ncbi:MAG: DUF177 domain-containing protein, partial [Anaerolineae bacterium]|nr:DUF177 domain-containing protein [Anaerolineae bacterium]
MQTELQFNVAQLLKEVTGGFRIHDIEAPIDGEIDDDVVAVVTPLVGQVKLLRTGPNILVTGQLESTIKKSCGRCLSTFTTPITIELEEEFYPLSDINTSVPIVPPPDAEQSNRIDNQHILDLSEVVRQELVLASEGLLYCQANCRGLCPHCGHDRNDGACDCEENKIDA